MGIDVWRLRGQVNASAAINAAGSSAGRANEVRPRAAEPERSVDDRDLINGSPDEPVPTDSVQVRLEKACLLYTSDAADE